MRANGLTRDGLNFLKEQRGQFLRVHSVFAKAINLINDQQHLLAILDLSKDQGPISLQVEFNPALASVLPGDLVEITSGGLEFVRDGLKIDINGLKPANLTIQLRKLCRERDEMAGRYAELKQAIMDEGSMDGLAPLIDPAKERNNYCNFVEDNLSQLIDWIDQGDVKMLRNGLSGVLGFGPGLTPSTDDYLVGLMLAAFVLRKDYPNPIFSVLLDDLPKIARGKTTLISEEMMRLAAQGKVSHSYKAFITGFFGRTPGNIRQLARQVFKTGASSGTDFLYGVYASQAIVLNELGGKNAKSSSQEE